MGLFNVRHLLWVGAALTLDEFALWLNFKDVYWEKQGLESLDAIVVFLSLLAVAISGGPFLAGVARECARKLRSRVPFRLQGIRRYGESPITPPGATR